MKMNKKVILAGMCAGLSFIAIDTFADASKLLTNPAEMYTINAPELTFNDAYLDTSYRYKGTVIRSISTSPLISPVVLSGTAKANTNLTLPGGFLAVPITPNLVGAIGMGSPLDFAYNAHFPADSTWRFEYTDLWYQVKDFMPGLSYKFSDKFAIGGALDFDYMQSKYQVARVIPTGVVTRVNALSTNIANGWGFGGHVGIVFWPSISNRIRINYRTAAHVNQSGGSKFNGGSATGALNAANNTYHFHAVLPGQYNFKFTQFFSKQIFVDFGMIWTNWGKIRTINLRQVAVPIAVDPAGSVTSAQNFNWHDNIIYSLALTYLGPTQNYGITGTGGVDTGYAKNMHATPLAQIEVFDKIKNFTIGFSYLHYFYQSYPPAALGSSQINGTWKPTRDVIGAKIIYSFA